MDIIFYEAIENVAVTEKILHFEYVRELVEFMKIHPTYTIWYEESKDSLIISEIVLA